MATIGQSSKKPADDLQPIRLTPRETEVLNLIFEGKPSQEVADQLYISKRTVDFHLANIYQKLEVTNRAQAFYEAARRGLISYRGRRTRGMQRA